MRCTGPHAADTDAGCDYVSTLVVVFGLLLLLLVLRMSIASLPAEHPRWLETLLTRGRYFDQRGNHYQPAVLSAAIAHEMLEREESLARKAGCLLYTSPSPRDS